MAALETFPSLARFLAGNAASWPELNITVDALVAVCDAERVAPLLHQRLSHASSADSWPSSLRARLLATTRAMAAEEALRGAETRRVVAALAAAGIRPILVKGTALAYTLYDAPVCRPRNDTDVLIAAAQVEPARRVFIALGYTPTVQCQDLFSQFEVQKTDAFGLVHAFDVHWRISTQPRFADLLNYEELLLRAVPVAALGEAAIAPGAVDGLLLACVHPVMHHRNVTRALWVFDIHLLASQLDPHQFDEFATLARRRKVAAICAHGLRLAREMFGTAIPPRVIDTLAAAGAGEPSAEYLASERRWHDELASSLRATRSLGGRARLLRQVLFPGPRYMLGAYGLDGRRLAALLLPALYAHRNLRGLWNIVTGKK